MFEAASGFFIEETEKSLDDDKEKTYTFDTEAGVIQHIVIKMTPRIGYHQQWESMSQRRKDEP